MATAAVFLQTVASEVVAVQRFVGLLEREQQLLIKGEIDDLIDLARQKHSLAAELSTLASQRTQLLAASGLSSDRAGMVAWFAAHPDEAQASAAWEVLLAGAAQARELNRVNGELIQVRMQDNALALATLLGSAAAANLYGPDGQSTPSGGRRISDSA